ncbi:hypothetical protein ASG92_09490 [Arthrobacter sp. Soil736]|uniref:hypothetical protein n=1 Tax=Arthrobacter sp. Soil736 TaxID=1736395 RepID=UPI0006F4C948|nr:hypothetical protein [Arthrobacter sp. Soil736]KRE50494.1 hypothetical protein ASG92_09490 [Arthrobacter sp. Soil736]
MPIVAIAVAVAAGLVLSWLLRCVLVRLNRRLTALHETSRMARLPLRLTLCLIGVRIALALTTEDAAWRRNVDHVLLIALIASVAWQHHPQALPHLRWETMSSTETRPSPARRPQLDAHPRQPSDPHDSQLFTGSIEAVERSRAFTGLAFHRLHRSRGTLPCVHRPGRTGL